MLNKNKNKIIGNITIAIGLLFVLTANVFPQNKKGDRLLHDYDLIYVTAEVNDSCCIEYIVHLPDMAANHNYNVSINGDTVCTVYSASDTSYSKLFCPPEEAKWQSDYTAIFKVICNDNGDIKIDTLTLDLSNCCDCELEGAGFGLISIVPVDDPNCAGCAFELEYADRMGLPDWTNCFDSMNVKFNVLTPPQEKIMTFDLNSFTPSDFGTFCLPDLPGISGKITINFRKHYETPQDSGVITVENECKQSFYFDCTGIKYTPDSTDNSYPETEPCSPDCDSVPWIERTDSLTTVIDGVTVNITYIYYTREACGKQDIQVTDIIYTGYLPQPFLGEGDVFKRIIQKIIDVNKMGFEPIGLGLGGTDKCDTTWRVTMGSCWAEQQYHYSYPPFDIFGQGVVILGEGDELDAPEFIKNHFINYMPFGWGKYMKKCEDVDCCKQRFEVCNTLDNGNIKKIITPLPTPENILSCDNEYTWVTDWTHEDGAGSYWVQCEPKCDWLAELVSDSVGVAKISINEQNKFEIAKYHLKDFYSNEQIQIDFKSNEKTILDVHLYDISGKYILTKETTFGTGNHQVQINTGSLKTGTYYYIIIINNTLIKSNKFVIVK